MTNTFAQKSVYSAVSIFDPLKENLELVGDTRNGNIKGFPCLTVLDFKLFNSTLSLCSLWRHQFFDTKGCGNCIFLAIILKIVCDLTNKLRSEKNFKYQIKQGKITSIACRADFKTLSPSKILE